MASNEGRPPSSLERDAVLGAPDATALVLGDGLHRAKVGPVRHTGLGVAQLRDEPNRFKVGLRISSITALGNDKHDVPRARSKLTPSPASL